MGCYLNMHKGRSDVFESHEEQSHVTVPLVHNNVILPSAYTVILTVFLL